MLDGPPIKMAVFSKPNNVWVVSESADDQEAGQFIASIEDRICARFSDISKGDEAVAPPPPLPDSHLRACRILIESAGIPKGLRIRFKLSSKRRPAPMAKPYSMDLRERAMRRVAAGESARSVAAVLKGSASSVIKWAQRQRRTGSFAPGKMGGHR